MELPLTKKLEVLQAKLEQLNAQLYSNKLDMKCAEELEDEQWKDRIRQLTQRIMTSVEILENELDDLSK